MGAYFVYHTRWLFHTAVTSLFARAGYMTALVSRVERLFPPELGDITFLPPRRRLRDAAPSQRGNIDDALGGAGASGVLST